MRRLTAALAALLRWMAGLLPAGRREWAEAVGAEAAEVPAGRARLSWLAGGLWLVAREADMIRKICYTAAGGAIGTVLVCLDWHPGSANPAMPTNRITMVVVVLVLAVLPWIAHPALGPVADNRAARIVRIGGYTAIYALLAVIVGLSRFASSRFDHFRAFDQANWEADMRSGAVVGAVLIIVLIGGYAAGILAITSRRASVPPAILAIGAGAGVAAAAIGYVLMPLGNPLHPDNGLLAAGYGILLVLALPGTLLAAGLRAGRHAATRTAESCPGSAEAVEAARLREGSIAGLCAGGTAALLLAIVTISTMLLLPRHVDLRWANPDPDVPHGTTYEVQMSVGDAAIKYEGGLLLGPLIGLALGAIGGIGVAGTSEPRGSRRRPDPDLATTQ